MSAATNSKVYQYIFQWKIENLSSCWWMKMGEEIESPPFIADGLQSTKWSLVLFPMGTIEPENIGLFLKRDAHSKGPEVFEVSLQLALLGKHGSILKERTWSNRAFLQGNEYGTSLLEERERVFVTEKEEFIHEDTILVQCTLWTDDERSYASDLIFATTVIKVKRRSLVWKIDKSSAREESERVYNFKDYLIRFNAVLNDDLDKLNLVMNSFDDNVLYVSCGTSVLNSEGKKVSCGIKKYFADDLKNGTLTSILSCPEIGMEDKSKYFPNDALSLHFELVISTVKHNICHENSSLLENEEVEFENLSILIEDIKLLYEGGILTDTKIRTPTKSFPAHKNILSARSSVFSDIFSRNMNENDNGHVVDINDFDDDTVHRMLLYIYTDSLENMQFESTCKLYAIANEYRILSLISRCSSFLFENLYPKNVCKVLALAVLHRDDDLKRSVENCILGQVEDFFCTKEWKDFMISHVEIAADIMHRKITKK